VLKENGVVLYNVSYSAENNPNIMWLLISEIINKTDFMVADCIIWKKNSALPNNVSPNKLTRITEFVFVFCRKKEYLTFSTNKKVKSQSKTGQRYYENIFNFIEAKNNDGSNNLNKATFSTEFCEKLIDIYLKKGDLVYDSFMGTGTTANACKIKGLNYIGSELSPAQVEYSKNRIFQQVLTWWKR
jgi:site-specific DNA-methyltransferase (adenine-specific)